MKASHVPFAGITAHAAQNLADAMWHDQSPWQLPVGAVDTTCHVTFAVTDRAGRRWRTTRRARTGRDGQLRLSPAGVLPFLAPENARAYWRDVRDNPAVGSRPDFPDLDPIELAIHIASDGPGLSFVQRRHQRAMDTTPQPVAAEGARGLFFTASQPAHGIGLVTMPGSSGGLDAKAAALLAADGFDVLALGLFGYADLSPDMAMLPLEHVAAGISWMRRRLGHARIALRGISKGSEAASLTAIHFPDLVGALVLWVPSPMATSGRSAAAGAAPLYTLRGRPLPYGVAQFPPDASPAKTSRAKPIPMDVYFERMWRDPACANLCFELERATCPILIVSGSDDGLWPSKLGGEMIVDRLARHEYSPRVTHLVNAGAGHLFNVPLQVESCASVVCHPVQRWWLRAGGTPRANASAALHSWNALQEFLLAAFDRAPQPSRAAR
jgi:pimeloyl-ACP methyl ester carboxylesterase